jgi:DNA primase
MILGKNTKEKLYAYFKTRVGMVDYTRGWLKGTCPRCGKFKFGVNISSNRANCFYCGPFQDPLTTVKELENFRTKQEVYNLLNNLGSVSGFVDYTPEIQYELGTSLPTSFTPLNLGDSQYGKSARNYMKRRGFDILDLTMAGFGYCTEGKYQGYIIMPFYQDNLVIYFHARLYMGDGPKFNNPPIEEVNVGKSLVIYNVDSLAIYNTIYVVESVLNARTLGDNAIAGGGKSFSNHQFSTILKSPVKNIIILLDPDALDKAFKMALLLVPHKKVKVVVLPEGEDVNSLGRKHTLNICRKTRYLNYNQILELKHSYEKRIRNTY